MEKQKTMMLLKKAFKNTIFMIIPVIFKQYGCFKQNIL